MSKKINLDEFWNKRYPHGKLPKYAKDIIMEYSKELLELAAENAYAIGSGSNLTTMNGSLKWTFAGHIGNVEISKQSILDTINQIE